MRTILFYIIGCLVWQGFIYADCNKIMNSSEKVKCEKLAKAQNEFDEFADVHPKCPFLNFTGVDIVEACTRYDILMGDCGDEGQAECSNKAFEQVAESYPSRKEKREKVEEDVELAGCTIEGQVNTVTCPDGRVYTLNKSSLKDVMTNEFGNSKTKKGKKSRKPSTQK